MEALKKDPRPDIYLAIQQVLKSKGWDLDQDPRTPNPYNLQLLPLVPTTQLPTLKIVDPEHTKWRELLTYHRKGVIEFTRLSITEVVIIFWSPQIPRAPIESDQAVIVIDYVIETLKNGMISILTK